MTEFSELKKNCMKNMYIREVKYISYGVIKITYQDYVYMYIDIKGDSIHPYYTYMESDKPEFYYYSKMPHENIMDLYYEINRMNNDETRKKKCKYGYFKCI